MVSGRHSPLAISHKLSKYDILEIIQNIQIVKPLSGVQAWSQIIANPQYGSDFRI